MTLVLTLRSSLIKYLLMNERFCAPFRASRGYTSKLVYLLYIYTLNISGGQPHSDHPQLPIHAYTNVFNPHTYKLDEVETHPPSTMSPQCRNPLARCKLRRTQAPLVWNTTVLLATLLVFFPLHPSAQSTPWQINPPAGYKPGENRAPLVLHIAIPLAGLAVFLACLRFYVRTCLVRVVGKDDWLLLASVIGLCGLVAAVLWGLSLGIGRHLFDLYKEGKDTRKLIAVRYPFFPSLCFGFQYHADRCLFPLL